jgi:hypothetical protein
MGTASYPRMSGIARRGVGLAVSIMDTCLTSCKSMVVSYPRPEDEYRPRVLGLLVGCMFCGDWVRMLCVGTATWPFGSWLASVVLLVLALFCCMHFRSSGSGWHCACFCMHNLVLPGQGQAFERATKKSIRRLMVAAACISGSMCVDILRACCLGGYKCMLHVVA